MTEEYRKVKMPEKGEFKFVLIEHKEGIKLRGDHLKYHSDIVDKIKATEGLVGRVLGGGKIRVSPETKEIFAFDSSFDYGEAPQDKVESLLREYAKQIGFSIKVNMGEW